MSLADPPRLLDGHETPAELRSLLGMAREDLLGEAASARVAAAVQAGLGGGGAPPDPSGGAPSAASAHGAAAGAGSAARSAVGGKLAPALVAVAVAAGGIWYAVGQPDGRDGSAAPASASAEAIPAAPSSSAASAAPSQGADPIAAQGSGGERAGAHHEALPREPSSAASADRASRATSPSSTKSPSAADLAEEHRLLRGARALLERDPSRALALTAEHERRFPNGVLAQEREVIAIAALARLGQDEAARSRADHFATDYPDSPHRDRVGEATSGQGAARP
jgi:hypothetical protein